MNIPHKRRALREEMTPNLPPPTDYAQINGVIDEHKYFSITDTTRITPK